MVQLLKNRMDGIPSIRFQKMIGIEDIDKIGALEYPLYRQVNAHYCQFDASLVCLVV